MSDQGRVKNEKIQNTKKVNQYIYMPGNAYVISSGDFVGGSFTFKVQSWNDTEWIDVPGKSAVTVYEADTSGTKVVDIEDVLDGVLFTEVGSWAYQILEVKGAVENVTYDRTLYTFTVKVTDNNGQLTATITDVNNEIIDDGVYEVTFNNTYHTAPVNIDVIKNVENNSGDSSVSKAGFDFTAIRTDANVGAATIENRATATDGTNEYETDVVTNYTVEDEVGKEVFSESDPSINIDGRKVLVGDVLVYAISYTNTSKESANVTIVDTIPQYTSYVIGSADNAGVFENGKITWNLEVAPEQTVTVTFKVRVEDGGANAPIANKAQVLEGRNTYTTNEIINPSDTPVPPNPPTSDENNLWKWITLLFISGTGLTGIKKYKKNRADADNA